MKNSFHTVYVSSQNLDRGNETNNEVFRSEKMNARDRPAFILAISTTHEYLLMFFLFSRVLFLVVLNLNMTQIHLVSLTIVKAKPGLVNEWRQCH